MTFGANMLVDDHYAIANNYFSDLLFETGQFDFVSTPDVTLTDGWITRMAPGASYQYAFGRLKSRLGPSRPRPYQFFWRGMALHDLEVTIVQRGTVATPEWKGLVPVNLPPQVTLDPSLPQFIIIRNPAAVEWVGEFRFGIAEDDKLTSPAFRAWSAAQGLTGARLMDLGRAKYAEQDHKLRDIAYPTMHGDWRQDFAGITISQGLRMAAECAWQHVWLSVPPGMSPAVLVASLANYSGCPAVTLEHGGNEIWNRGASQKAGHYYLNRAHQAWGTFTGTPGDPQDFTQAGWVLDDDDIAYTPSGQMWPDKMKNEARKTGRVDPILLSNEAIYVMAMQDAAACLREMVLAWTWNSAERCFVNKHGVRIYNTMGGQNGNPRFVENIVKVFAEAMTPLDWQLVQDCFSGFAFAPYLEYQQVTKALPPHARDPNEPTNAEFWTAAETTWQRALGLMRGNVAAQPAGWRHAVYEFGLSFIDGRDNRSGDWWTAKRFSVDGDLMNIKMAADLAAEGPWAAMVYGMGITGEEYVPGQAYGQGFWSILRSWDDQSDLLREMIAAYDPPVDPPIDPPVDPVDEREAIALELEALAVRVRAL